MRIAKSVVITLEQANYISKNKINLSELIQGVLDKMIKESKKR